MGIDGVPIRFLKINSNKVSELLAHIINRSLQTLIVPQGWKLAQITPLFEAGVRMDPGSARG